MHLWHHSMWDPVYMVGSYFVSGDDYPKIEIVLQAREVLKGYLEKPHSSWTKKDLRDLKDVIRYLDEYIEEKQRVN